MRTLLKKPTFKKLILPLIGLSALLWFLIRVIPKPSRASYPCMRTAAPLASSFVIYIIGLFTSAFLFNKAKSFLRQTKYLLFGIAIIASIIVTFFTIPVKNANAANYTDQTPDGPNKPMGEGIGIMPGRVAWIYNPDVTNENCTNKGSDLWYMDQNTNQNLVTGMFADGIMMVTNTTNVKAAWDSIFFYYNRTHGKGNVGYQAGEKIAFKINLNGTQSTSVIVTSPKVIYSIIKLLIDTVGVKAEDITYGDPWLKVTNMFEKIHTDFPGVKAIGYNIDNITSTTEKIRTSDSTNTTAMPECYVEASYLINVPVFKKHHRGGISLSSKNHFGTMAGAEGGAGAWHYSLPASEGAGDVNNGEYGLYRCFVDFMGYKHLGGKTILYVIDGLWGSTNWAHPPIKWRMSPFNNDYPSSLFISQDPVAIESVGFDFLLKEFDNTHPTEGVTDRSDNRGPFPHYPGTDDFLHQAADTDNWPVTIKYGPNSDGVHLKSMGAHEHWNNALDKKYSRNMGLNKGIELVSNYVYNSINSSSTNNSGLSNVPNPFSSYTEFYYNLQATSNVCLFIYDMKGSLVRELINFEQYTGKHEVRWDGMDNNGQSIASGIYLAKLSIRAGGKFYYQTLKVVKR